jgi:hypothetical protein
VSISSSLLFFHLFFSFQVEFLLALVIMKELLEIEVVEISVSKPT